VLTSVAHRYDPDSYKTGCLKRAGIVGNSKKAESLVFSRFLAFLASPSGFEPLAFRLGEPPNQRNGLMPAAIPYAECKAVQWFSCFSLLPTFSQKSAVFFATGGWLFAPRWNTDARLSFRLMLMCSYCATG